MKNKYVLLCFFLTILIASFCRAAQSPDVMCGPFSSWLNAKTGYNAKGDGTTNDAPALQNALNALASSTTSRVLYIPAGTYRITTGLTLSNTRNLEIIGEDPATTIIKWDGAANGNMLTQTGIAFCKNSRLTFDGASKANIGLLYKWCYTGNFPTTHENSDLIFHDMQVGIYCGIYDAATFSSCQNPVCEVTFIRCKFTNCAQYGIIPADPNSVDLWVRFCLFQNCGTGVGIGHQGDINVYQSVFKNNILDIDVRTNLCWCSVRNNYSSGSGHFLYGSNKITIANNTIVSPATSNVILCTSQYSWILLMDNIIQSPTNATSVVTIGNASTSGAKLVSVNNTFTMANYNASPATRTAIRSVGDKVVDRNTLTLVEPVLPSTPDKFTGPVIEPTAMTGAAIQAAIITAATTYKGQHPVVHLKTGNYTVSNKIVIPANCDVRLVGDHGGLQDVGPTGTKLTWAGIANDTVLLLKNPSRAELKDFYITSGNAKPYGIFIDKADQAGARVFLDQVTTNQFIPSSNRRGVYADGLDNCVVEGWHCFVAGAQGAIVSKGGPRSANGDTTTTSRVDIFGGNGGHDNTTYPMFDVKNNGKLMVQDLWWETGSIRGVTLNLSNTSSGTLTLNGGKNQYHTNAATGNPTHIINGFKGLCTFINMDLYDAIVNVAGSQAAQNVFCLLSSFKPNGSPSATDPGATYTMSATAGTNVMMYNEYWTQMTPAPVDIGTPSDAWLLKMLKQTRTEQPSWDIGELPTGVTDVRIWRVGMDNCLDALTIKGGGDTVSVKRAVISNPAMHQPLIKKSIPGMNPVSVPSNAKHVKLFDCTGKTLATFSADKNKNLSHATAQAIAAAGQKVVLIKTME